MLQYRLYEGNSLPVGLEGFVKAGANIGSVIGQFAFGAFPRLSRSTEVPDKNYVTGFAADYFGRKAVCTSPRSLLVFRALI